MFIAFFSVFQELSAPSEPVFSCSSNLDCTSRFGKNFECKSNVCVTAMPSGEGVLEEPACLPEVFFSDFKSVVVYSDRTFYVFLTSFNNSSGLPLTVQSFDFEVFDSFGPKNILESFTFNPSFDSGLTVNHGEKVDIFLEGKVKSLSGSQFGLTGTILVNNCRKTFNVPFYVDVGFPETPPSQPKPSCSSKLDFNAFNVSLNSSQQADQNIVLIQNNSSNSFKLIGYTLNSKTNLNSFSNQSKKSFWDSFNSVVFSPSFSESTIISSNESLELSFSSNVNSLTFPETRAVLEVFLFDLSDNSFCVFSKDLLFEVK
ncbi:MAG: hypothetical protein ABH821_02635 [archaeon]